MADTSSLASTAAAPPSEVFGELFAAVAMSDILPAKDWADAAPKAPVQRILEAYRREAPADRDALSNFIRRWFDVPLDVVAPRGAASLAAHIEATWPTLIRPPVEAGGGDATLSLPHAFVAPGGRFRECYYWDAYFTLLGLRNRPDIIRAVADNFRWQIETLGFVPTANRSYYLSRSQPPLLFKIVELLAEVEGAGVIADYLPALVAEHRFWMDGADRIAAGEAFRRVVALPDGAILNRYWDDRARPRDESWLVDVATAAAAPDRDSAQVYRDLRAGAESGWDFSSRWLSQRSDLASIVTTAIAPVDLNSILFGLERFLCEAFASLGQKGEADMFCRHAERRRHAMSGFWNPDLGCFDDVDWRSGRVRGATTAAATLPLFFGLASEAQACSTANVVERVLLAPGGVLATPVHSGLQWDAPNGWAPLQWFAAGGLERYGACALAREIRLRWVGVVSQVFNDTGRLVEKYDVINGMPGGGGEYPLQDGFGWTNGVTAAFLERG